MTVELDLPDPTYVGTAVTTKITFRNPGSSRPVDPTTVTLVWNKGDGSQITWVFESSGSIVRARQGIYLGKFSLDVPGAWGLKWEGTGACEVVEVAQFPVQATAF